MYEAPRKRTLDWLSTPTDPDLIGKRVILVGDRDGVYYAALPPGVTESEAVDEFVRAHKGGIEEEKRKTIKSLIIDTFDSDWAESCEAARCEVEELSIEKLNARLLDIQERIKRLVN